MPRKPGGIMKKVLLRKHKKIENASQKAPIRKKHKPAPADRYYGPDADNHGETQQQVMEPDVLEQKCQEFLAKLELNAKNARKLEQDTRGQHNNQLWKDMRRDLLTASNYGPVCKLRPSTLAANTVKNILYGHDLSNNPYIVYGRIHEDIAIRRYENERNVKVEKCGLFIDQEHPFLAASPDGIITGENGLVEVKCLPSVDGKFVDMIEKKNRCYDIRDGTISLKPRHNYMYQVQGQLNVTKRDFCDLILYCENDFHIERIWRNETFWQEMIPLLTRFYRDCLLPELVDPLHPRKFPMREPQYRLEAHEKIKKKNE